LNSVIALTRLTTSPIAAGGSVISPNSVAFGTDYVKVVEDTPYFLQRKCRRRPKNVVLATLLLVV